MKSRATSYEVHNLAPGVFVIEINYCNAIFIITDEGALVMETYNTPVAKILKKEIAKRTDKPVKYLVYSHANTDHIRGGGVFADTAKFIAQKRQLPRLEYIKEDSFPMPDIVFNKKLELNLGGKRIVLRDYGLNHATGVLVLYLPQDKIISAIDTAYVRRLPFYFMPDFNPRAWRDSLREIQRLDFDTVITGHGPIGRREDFIEFANYLDDLLDQVQRVWKRVHLRGPFEGVEIAKKEVDLSKYKNWGFYKEFRDLNIMAAYFSLDMGY